MTQEITYQQSEKETMFDVAQATNKQMLYLGEHGIVVGATGSGKTVFTCRGLLDFYRKAYPHVPKYVIDSTSDPDMDTHIPDAIHIEGNRPPDLLVSASEPLIWTPRNSKVPAAYAEFFDNLIDSRQPAVVIVDEVASITKQALEGLEALVKQMRKHGGTIIIETQRIAKVDSDLFSQVSHFWLFRINPEPYDIQQARTYLNIPKEEFRMPRGKYGFYHRRTRTNQPAAEYVDYHSFFDAA